MYDICRLAGVRLSWAPDALLTLTAILTGLRRPTRTSWSRASDTLALNRPVLRCLGRRPRMRWSVSLKPRSSKRSASSMIKASKDDCGQCTCGEDKTSSNRPGVAMRMFGDVLRKVDTSCWGLVVPPSSSCGTTLGVDEGNLGSGGGALSASSCTSTMSVSASCAFMAARAAADGGWKASKESRTECICVASSRVGDIMIAPTWCFLVASSSRSSRSIVGMRKASVLPLPVTAWPRYGWSAQLLHREHRITLGCAMSCGDDSPLPQHPCAP